MKFIPLKSPRLIKYLQSITNILYKDEYKKLIGKTRIRNDNLIPDLYACSEDYLRKAFTLKVQDYGFPRSSLGLGVREFDPDLLKVTEPIHNLVEKIGQNLGSPNNALTMAYPDKGFIGWHHNGNAPGYNILMTYSQDGNGCFKYYDRINDSVVVMPDQPGWTVKVGYYPSEKNETDRVYWHCADTAKQRISVAWILNHRTMWENMIDSISDGTFDKSVLNQDQMKVKP